MPAKKKRVQAKHDWIALKQEFMTGDWRDITDFLRSVLGKQEVTNNWARRQTKGWAEEKEARRTRIMEKVLEKTEQDTVALAESALRSLMINVAEQAKNGDIPATDKKILWSMLRVEANKPTTITAGEMKQRISIEDEPTILPKF